jgi:hypothetical protein
LNQMQWLRHVRLRRDNLLVDCGPARIRRQVVLPPVLAQPPESTAIVAEIKPAPGVVTRQGRRRDPAPNSRSARLRASTGA